MIDDDGRDGEDLLAAMVVTLWEDSEAWGDEASVTRLAGRYGPIATLAYGILETEYVARWEASEFGEAQSVVSSKSGWAEVQYTLKPKGWQRVKVAWALLWGAGFHYRADVKPEPNWSLPELRGLLPAFNFALVGDDYHTSVHNDGAKAFLNWLGERKELGAIRYTNRYGVRFMGTWPHISLGVSAHVWPLKFAHVSLHLPIGVLIIGMIGAKA